MIKILLVLFFSTKREYSFLLCKLNIIFTLSVVILNGCSVGKPITQLNEQERLARNHRAAELIEQGISLLGKGALNKAEANFVLANELTGDAKALDGLGCIALRRKDLDKAERFFKKAYLVDPNYHNVLGNLAYLEIQKGNFKKAEMYFLKALRNDTLNYKSRANYALLKAHFNKPRALNLAFEANTLNNNAETRKIVKLIEEKLSDTKN